MIEEENKARFWRYNENNPEGKLFEVPESIAEDVKKEMGHEGWVDSPALINGQSDVSHDDVLMLHSEGKKPGEIGKLVNLPHQTVSKIIKDAQQ